MRITLCGSIVFFDEMESIRQKLEELGHEVKTVEKDIADENGVVLDMKARHEFIKSKSSVAVRLKTKAMKEHFAKVDWCEAILIVNEEKKSIPGYIGMNTMLEAGLAFHLEKKIFLFNDIPKVDYEDEIRGMVPIVINGDLSKIV